MATASRKVKGSARRDRISKLPDETLCHILSFLQTQQAVATSVLSKRWRHLWTSVPALDYDEEIYRNNDRPSYCFEKFIYATILARDLPQPIRSFRLKYEPITDCYNGDLNVWVNTVLQRGVEKLHIRMYTFCSSIILRIFSCKTLVALKLRGLHVNASSPIEFPSLKSLHLVEVEFIKPQSLLKLIRGCPILEDLKARFIHYADHDAALDGSFCEGGVKILPKLVRADLSPLYVDVPLKAICDVEFLTLSISKYPLDDVVPEFPNLIHVVLKVEYCMNWHLVLQMLKNCPKLQVFELVCDDDLDEDSFLPHPHFVHECLPSQFRKCSLINFYGTESELRFARYIMQNSTTLQTMTISSKPSLSPRAKHEMLKELALCPRRSTLCELSFK